MNINTKNIIKIPYNINIFYCAKKKVMIIQGPYSKNFLKLDVEIFIKEKKRKIFISSNSNTQKPKINLKKMQGTTVALIKQGIYNTLTNICFKLLLIGIGYKAFYIDDSQTQLLKFRLGFSHSLFFRIPESIKITCLKFTKLFIYGDSYYEVTQAALKLRRKKVPEPYKGKGIKYENEKITLKLGKKV